MTPREKRSKAAQACIDRFGGRPFDMTKRRDCARLAGHLLHHLDVAVPPLKGARYSTPAGALRAMRRLGFASLVEAVDSLGLERIAPARAVTGDLVALEAGEGDPFGCVLTVSVGNGRVFGFIDGKGQALQPHKFITAWRTI